MTAPLSSRLLLLCALALAGCDDLLLFDVAADGRIVAAVDGQGHVAALGDGQQPRHLVRVDPASGQVERLTASPLAFTQPRACGEGVVLVQDRTRLLHFVPGQPTRTLFESERRLLQPTPSPSGAHVAVLEADRPGVPGRLQVLDIASGELREPIEGALLGFAWAGETLLFARSSQAVGEDEEPQPCRPGPAEVVALRGGESRVLFRGTLPGLTWLAPGPDGVACVLPRADRPDSLGVARLGLDRVVGAPEAAEGIDFWPCADAAGQVLFTRSRPDRPTLEGELRLTALSAPGTSRPVPTPGLVVAPRWVRGGRVAYLTPDDRLVTQALDGSDVVDWTERLRAAAGGAP